LASVPLPPGAISRGVVQDPDAVTAAVRRLVVENRLKGRRVVLGISTPQVVVRSLTLPAMPADKLRQALPFQARDVLPIPVDEALLDFSPLPPAPWVARTPR
jgi:type IV pilus assembly protein PilM